MFVTTSLKVIANSAIALGIVAAAITYHWDWWGYKARQGVEEEIWGRMARG